MHNKATFIKSNGHAPASCIVPMHFFCAPFYRYGYREVILHERCISINSASIAFCPIYIVRVAINAITRYLVVY